MINPFLLAAAVTSAVAAALHLGCIVGGSSWYRFLGAGERMARAAERGAIQPHLIAGAIATVLLVWGAYALSGASVVPRLPLLRTALVAIAGVLLLRAAALPVMLSTMSDRSPTFLWVSSGIVLIYGLLFAVGTATQWARLSG